MSTCRNVKFYYSQACLNGHLYIADHCLKMAASFFQLINNEYNFNLYIKGTFSGSLECPWYTDLTVLPGLIITTKINIHVLT
jgi:hypothetical protein